MPKKEEISAIQAARRLGVGLDYLYSLLWTGKLAARKKGGRWLVLESAIQKRLKEKTKHEK